MIGFDLDGVIISDINFKWSNDDLAKDITELFSIRDKLFPQFVPVGDFVIITGRPEIDRLQTENWLIKNKINFKKLHMCDMGTKYNHSHVLDHKAKWINNYSSEMDFFVESDIEQVNILMTKTNVKIIHFSSFIAGVFK